jgi:hypothetical protein
LHENVQLQSRVNEAIWDELSAKWKIKVETVGGIIEDEADILINGSGILK